MKERKRPSVHRRRRRRKRRIWLRLLPHIVLLTVCLTVILSITGSAFYQKSVSGEIDPNGTISNITGLESPLAKMDDPPNDKTPTEIEGADTPWYLTLVNRQNPLPENSWNDTVHLVDVPGGEKVDERIYGPLMEMMDAAEELGPIIVSGYRTQEKQQSLYDEKIRKYRNQGHSEEEAVQLAQQWVAIPGTSEHQLGLAVDINGATYDIYLWLQENSYQYGFIFRYPGNKTHITGTAEEVWHYRYVGKEAAAEIYERGICLEEYLEDSQDQIFGTQIPQK